MNEQPVPQHILDELEDIQDEMEVIRCRTVFEDRLKRGDVTVWEILQMFDTIEQYRRKR